MSDATNKTIIALLLAAGNATRFGATKQTAEFRGMPLVKRAVGIAGSAAASATTIVLGHDWQAVAAVIAPQDGFLVLNDRYADGIGTSLALAVRASRHAADAVIVMLADQPLITPQHLDTLIESWSGASNEIVATSFGDTNGPPALFAADCFDALAQLQGDSGASALLGDSRFQLRTVAFADAAFDVDVPGDLSGPPRSARS